MRIRKSTEVHLARSVQGQPDRQGSAEIQSLVEIFFSSFLANIFLRFVNTHNSHAPTATICKAETKSNVTLW